MMQTLLPLTIGFPSLEGRENQHSAVSPPKKKFSTLPFKDLCLLIQEMECELLGVV